LQIIKQKGRRWLSGLLALIMIAGLFPATGITASAAGGGAPDKIYIQKAAYANAGSFEDPNLPSSNPKYNHQAWMRVFYMDVGDDQPFNPVPGFCGNHDLNITTKPYAMEWSNGESIQTAAGGKYMPAYNIIKDYVGGFLLSNYIRDNCGITKKNWSTKYPDVPRVTNYETAVQQWAHEMGYGMYSYQSEWSMQLDSACAQSATWQCGMRKAFCTS